MLSASQFDGARWISYPEACSKDSSPLSISKWWLELLATFKRTRNRTCLRCLVREELLVLEGFRTGWHQQFVLDAGPNVVSVAGCERSLNPFVLWLGNCFHIPDFTLIVADRHKYRHKTQVGFWLPWVKIKEHKARRKPACEEVEEWSGRNLFKVLSDSWCFSRQKYICFLVQWMPIRWIHH